jgi:SAM-dependent methyltransferase
MLRGHEGRGEVQGQPDTRPDAFGRRLWRIVDPQGTTMTTAAFEPRRFRTAAAHYGPGRPDYAPTLIRRVARLCGLGAGSRVLDLGCGPGLLSVAFAPFAGHVIAIDPEPEMLAVVRTLAIANLEPVQGSSFDLGPALGRFRLAMMGRSFHWMDRADTLRRLDELLEHGAAVALFDTSHPDVPANVWTAEFRALRRRYEDDADHPRRAPEWLSHEAILLDSAFSRLEALSVIESRQVPLGSLVDRALSMSGTSPERLGARTSDFAQEIERLMLPYARRGMVMEVVESRARLGFRPGEEP